MKKFAFCMVVLALGTVTFAGCNKDDKAPATTPAAGETETPDADTDAPAADDAGSDTKDEAGSDTSK